ncbi:unnamed protein product [Miscanthus lutarioriparius]|uniref:RNase H type-1 domain-containing protein n=1 Tax=Miscanthus lutarioriparius TaxID=422564 RepID=A0A811NSN7_9POAL|nr:unnamed protein product [Miscanthus lutarioriparius]
MPEEGTLKINVDGAFSQESGTGATGAVLRGNSGNFLATSARWLESLGSALLAEAEALWDGVQLIPEGIGERIKCRDGFSKASFVVEQQKETPVRDHCNPGHN